MRSIIPKRTVLSVVVLIVENSDRTQMLVLVVLRVGTWLETGHLTKVRLEVMLSEGLIHRMHQ